MKVRAVILAGGEGSRLGVLTDKRAKPAVPFAGKYRIIDFALSNCVNSGITDVMILTQYRPHSLNEHIKAGRPWDLDRSFTGGITMYQPFRGRLDTDWYKGTADAITQNLSFVEKGEPDLVLVLSGDHIYKMNYASMIAFHAERQADVTIAALNVSRDEAIRMGILATDPEHRVTQFVEKPKDPPGSLASMGVYVFGRSVLARILSEDRRRRDSSHDFGKDIIPRIVGDGMRVFAFPFEGYWVDVGTVEAYWHTHMDLLKSPPPLDLNDRSWVVHTSSEERPPVRLLAGALVKDSLITDGCVIAPGARIERSILSPGVTVEQDAVVCDSVVLTDCVIGARARVERSILDKQVHVGANARVGGRRRRASGNGREAEEPGITTVGKNAHIPAGIRIPPGSVVAADAAPEYFADAGSTAGTARRPKAPSADTRPAAEAP